MQHRIASIEIDGQSLRDSGIICLFARSAFLANVNCQIRNHSSHGSQCRGLIVATALLVARIAVGVDKGEAKRPGSLRPKRTGLNTPYSTPYGRTW